MLYAGRLCQMLAWDEMTNCPLIGVGQIGVPVLSVEWMKLFIQVHPRCSATR